MKGILLAGGSGTRLHPLTQVISKQLLPIYNKPLIYYPLSTLMLAGIKDILVITTPEDNHLFKRLLKDGSQWGIQITYAAQPKPEGIAQAFIIGKEFIQNQPVALCLGDNIFFGHDFENILKDSVNLLEGAHLYAYKVQNPERYGVITLDDQGHPLKIEEKPKNPTSNWASTGLYFFDNTVSEYAASLKPSARGELEITDLLNMYLNQNLLIVKKLGRGFAWLDAGTFESLLEANNYVQIIEHRQGIKICDPKDIAVLKRWI